MLGMYWLCMGIMEKKVETTIMGYIGLGDPEQARYDKPCMNPGMPANQSHVLRTPAARGSCIDVNEG